MFKIFLILLQISYSHASGLFFAPPNLFPEFLKSPHQVRQENKQRIREREEYISNSDLRTNQEELQAAEQEVIDLQNNPYAMPEEASDDQNVLEVRCNLNNRWTVPGVLSAPGGGAGNPLQDSAAESEQPLLENAQECAEFFPEVFTIVPTKKDKILLASRALGEGAFGIVLFGKREAQQYAIKLMRKTENANSEIECLQTLNHFTVVGYDSHYERENQIALVLEFVPAGDLRAEIKRRFANKKFFEEHEVGFIFLQVLMALEHVHACNIIHGDIKSANILLQTNGLIKLSDFGLSQKFEEPISENIGEVWCGTPYYMAPEKYKRNKYSKKADMFSMGVLLHELLELQRPFVGSSIEELKEVICTQPPGPLSPRVSNEMKAIIELLLSKDPKLRPDCAEVLNMPLFRFFMSSFLGIVSSLQEHVAARQTLEGIRARCCPSAQFRAFEGVVFKQDSATGVWKKRYLKLSLDAQGKHQITLTVNKDALPESGIQVPLSKYVDAFPCLSPNSFGLMMPDGKKISFETETPEERDAWLQAINAAFK